MSYTKQTTVWCDALDCHEYFQWDSPFVGEVRAKAHDFAGWDFNNYLTRDLCPLHRPENPKLEARR